MSAMGPVCVVPSDATVGWVDRIDEWNTDRIRMM